jgi:hypothetical protein
MERARRRVAGVCPIGWLVLCTVLSPAVVAESAPITAPAPGTTADLRQALQTSLRRGAPDTTADSLATLRTIVDSPAFPSLTAAEQHVAISAAAQVALRAHDDLLALDLSRRATALPEQDIDDWRTRLHAANRLRRADDEVAATLAIGHQWGRALFTESDYIILQTAQDARNQHVGEPRLALLQWLYEQRWHLRDGDDPSQLWRDLSLHLLEAHSTEQARDVASHVTGPYQIVAMQADERFAKLVRFSYLSGDVRKAADERIRRLTEQVREHPRSLEHVVWLAGALLVRLRDAEVLAATDDPFRAIESEQGASSRFIDTEDQAGWIYDVRARALRDLGRNDEALELLRRAAAWPVKHDTVSHAINLASLLAELAHPQEALQALPDPGGASDYGRLMLAEVHLKVAAQLNDASAVDSAFQEAKQYLAASPEVLLHLLIIAGKNDEAARFLRDQLQDPEQRVDALIDIQSYVDTQVPPMVRDWRARLKAVCERPEVRSAIARVGAVRSYPLRPSGI